MVEVRRDLPDRAPIRHSTLSSGMGHDHPHRNRSTTVSTSSSYPPDIAPIPRDADRYDDHTGSGWVAFAAIMLVIVGVLNFIYGIAALDTANFYVNNAQYVISDLNTWGWVVMGIGAIQVVAAVSLLAGSHFGRWIGVFSAAGNAITQLLVLPGAPFLAISLLAIDVLVIYGLVAYGGRRQAS
jgi:hypothetical protein